MAKLPINTQLPENQDIRRLEIILKGRIKDFANT